MKTKKKQISQTNKKLKFFLHEVGVSCLLNCLFLPSDGGALLEDIVKCLKMNLVFYKVAVLKPGWEIVCCISQSHIVLSYYAEQDYLRINIGSCKRFNANKLYNFLNKQDFVDQDQLF